MPEGFRIATAFVEVKADASGLREDLKEKLDEAVAGMSAKARVDLDTSELDAKVDQAKAKVDELDATRAEPSIHLNAEELSAGADEARAKLEELDSRSALPDVGLEAGDLDARIDETKAKLDEIDSRSVAAPRSEYQRVRRADGPGRGALGRVQGQVGLGQPWSHRRWRGWR